MDLKEELLSYGFEERKIDNIILIIKKHSKENMNSKTKVISLNDIPEFLFEVFRIIDFEEETWEDDTNY